MNRFVVGVVAAIGVMSMIGVAPASAAVPASALVFSDGFESGGLSGYRNVTHSGVQQALVNTGSWAWRGTNPNGVPSYAYRRLSGSYNELWIGGSVYIASHASSVKLMAMRPVGQRSIDVYVDQTNRVSVRNNIGATTTYGTTKLANGGWHRIVLHAKVGNGTGSFDVSVDGVAVSGLSRTGQNVGSLAFGEVRLGDIAVAATFDVAIDDLAVSTSAQ